MSDPSNRFQATATISTDAKGNITVGKFSPPPNQIVVIEFVSGTCQANTTTKIIQLGIETQAHNVGATHTFLLNFLFTDAENNNNYIISEATQIYSDADTPIPLTITYQNDGPPIINCSITISGYLVQDVAAAPGSRSRRS
jgi:hypothetical protein